MTTLAALLESVKADGKVDASEVAALRAQVFADGVVDREEADALFELNDYVTGAENDSSYTEFVVEAITQHVLGDSVSPGEIDEEEAAWLIARIEGDGQVDGVELAVARAIQARATSVPASLSAKFAAWGV